MQALQYIVEEIHTVVAATTDDNGEPVTCAIDIMDFGTDSLYFLTAKGKNFYSRLKKQGRLAFTGIKGESTLDCIAVSVKGRVREAVRGSPHCLKKIHICMKYIQVRNQEKL